MTTTSERTRLTRAERIIVIGLVLVIAQVAFRVWSVGNSWFFFDDFLFMGAESLGDADLEYVFGAHNVHLMPLGYLLVKPVVAAGAFAWWAAAAQIILLQLAAGLACWWMLRTLFGDRPGTLVALGFYLFSPLVVPGTLWWAAAINQVPHHAALFAMIAAHVRYMQTRDKRWIAWASLFLILGLGSYAKMILAPGVVAMLAILYFSEGRLRPRLVTAIRRYLWAWIPYTVIAGTYLGYYFSVVPTTDRPTFLEVVQTIEITVARAFGPSALGGPWQFGEPPAIGAEGGRLIADTSAGLVVLSWVIIVIAATILHLRVRRSLWALWVLGPYLVLSAIFTAVSRAFLLGPELSSLEIRYIGDAAVIGSLCLGLALMPVRGATTSIGPRATLYEAIRPPRALGVIAIVVFLVGSAITSVQLALPWHGEVRMQQRLFVANAEASLQTAPQPVEVINTSVPTGMLWGAAAPYHMVDSVLSPFDDQFTVVEGGNNVQIFDSNGLLRAAAPDGDPRNEPGPEAGCGYRVVGGPTTVEIDPVDDFGVWVWVDYFSSDNGAMVVEAGGSRDEVDVIPGLNRLMVPQAGRVEDVTFRPLDDTNVCVNDIHVAGIVDDE